MSKPNRVLGPKFFASDRPADPKLPGNTSSRRRFLYWITSLGASLGIAPAINATLIRDPGEGTPSSEISGEDYYDKLGVAKIINAAGTYTTLTAACMPPSVLAAVQRAALHPVRLQELQQKAGEYIARRLKCEGAVVTSGASGAITLATAACLQLANHASPLNMPQAVSGIKNQVIVQKAHRYGYDHAIFLCGARITEVLTLDDYRQACKAGNAIMTNFFNAAEEENGFAGTAQISREQWLKVAHEHHIPCHLDAAADMPPISNLWKYTGMGFDLVSFSGGKGIRGPQNAGLLLGAKRLTELAHQNNNPNDGVGRGMKVAKEQIVGMVAAVDWVLSQTEETMQGDYQKRVDTIAQAVQSIPSIRTETVVPTIANHVPHLLIRFDPKITGMTTNDVVTILRKGTPSIELNPNTGQPPNQGIPSDSNTLVIGVWMLQPGEDAIVGARIHSALNGKA